MDAKPEKEVEIYGWNAVEAAFRCRPQAFNRMLLAPEMNKTAGPLCSYLASQRKSYAERSWNALTSQLGHDRHQGIVAYAMPRTPAQAKLSIYETWRRNNESVLLVESWNEPASLGRLLRTAVAFGFSHVLFQTGENGIAMPLPGEVYSEAAGAIEAIGLYQLETFKPLIKSISAKFLTICAGGEGASNIDLAKPLKAPGRPQALLVTEPISATSLKLAPQCEYRVKLPKLADVDAISAETNAAILMHWLHQGRVKEAAKAKTTGFRAKQKEKKAAKND